MNSTDCNYHLHFVEQGDSFDIDFQPLKDGSSQEAVSISGRSYTLLGDASKISWLKKVVPELTQSGITIEQLKTRLKSLNVVDLDIASRVESAAVSQLSNSASKKEGSWITKNRANLPKKQEAVANKYWERSATRFSKIVKTTKHIERLKTQKQSAGKGKAGRRKCEALTVQIAAHEKRLAELRKPDRMFLQFLKDCSASPSSVDAIFLSAVEHNDPNKFQKLFSGLSESQTHRIDNGERLNAISPTLLSRKPITVTESDLRDIEDYMRDTEFSGVVTISDRRGVHTLSTSNISDPQVPFAIHSVGKVFTGTLALRLIEEGIILKEVLDQPIQLNPKVIQDLPPKVQEQLQHTTLRKVMLHHGRYGDYLVPYQNAIEKAVKENRLPPVVDAPEDFLQFADKELVVPDKSGYSYSNLGLLLVGLSIQHLYNSQNGSVKSYDELLHDYVLKPAGVKLYERHKPDRARINQHDKVSPHITGGPAGGAWSTVGDLACLGNWLGNKYRDTDRSFSRLVEEFGGEFFSDKEFAHGGSIESASAHLSHRLENGVTIAVVSDKEGLGLSSDLAQVIQENVLKQTPLERATYGLEKHMQEVCPKGAGSMVMVSSLEEGVVCVTTGTSTTEGGKVDGQTAAIIGSGAKMFTALCCMALITKGVVNRKPKQPLTLNTKVSDVFSERQMKIFDDQKKAEQLTLGMLLSHTSGLVYFADDNRDDRAGQSLSEILDKKSPRSVKFYGHPGDQIYSYSNHIGLAAAMIEMACEKPYSEVLQETVLGPLGMDRTSYRCPEDDNVLLAYRPSKIGDKESKPTSVKVEVTDPMMQGAGGLWSCMDDMAKLGTAFGRALSQGCDLTNASGEIVISSEHLKSMVTPKAKNAPCGLALLLEGDVVGKGGGIHGYDFKFKVDGKSGSSVSMICNHAGVGDFDRYLETTSKVLRSLNPEIDLPDHLKPSSKSVKVQELGIEECPFHFKGFSGCLALPKDQPLTRINFNGTTLPVKKISTEGTALTDRYIIKGNSPFQGMELQMFNENQHKYVCLSNGVEEVWSFAEVGAEKFPKISGKELAEILTGASGDYDGKGKDGPDLYQVRVNAENGLMFSHSKMDGGIWPLSKCLVTAQSEKSVSFTVSLGGGPQPISYKLNREEKSGGWTLSVLNGETEEPICEVQQV